MTLDLDRLEALANAATLDHWWASSPEQAAYIMAMKPETTKELIAEVRRLHEALDESSRMRQIAELQDLAAERRSEIVRLDQLAREWESNAEDAAARAEKAEAERDALAGRASSAPTCAS